ncbi:hypothetical protein OSB04_029156 [Centaurea solstitialis]|uniref:Fe2OG dioxygenase domain-containing protein n=1 Tax=Centaurea solstitialis TaxID=347529 RepID=A0AA38SUL4_9ASTR|nr:hypothetical protein OSB04_029156 [Centaurea solstitialis]
MYPKMAMRDDETCETLKSQEDHKGVKHLCEMGITRVPNKYVLPAHERPHNPLTTNAYDANDLELPVIDFAQLHGPNHAQLIASVTHACENYGFFQVINHGISSDVIRKMEDVCRRFFELPLEEREKYMSTDIHSLVRYGTSFNQTNDSVFCWRDFLKLVCNPDAYSQWPESPSNFREMGVRYARKTKLLFQLLMETIIESLGLGLAASTNKTPKIDQDSGHRNGSNTAEEYDDIRKDIEDGSHLMVVNCFPPCPEPELTYGMPPHSDYGFLTLLHQDEVEGLQILHKDRWVTIRPHPQSFVVNVGDHLEIFSNGRYKSVMHRVLANPKKSRISVASLHSVPFGTTIKPSRGLINDKNPQRYMDTNFTDFIQYITACDSKHKNFLESRKISHNY